MNPRHVTETLINYNSEPFTNTTPLDKTYGEVLFPDGDLPIGIEDMGIAHVNQDPVANAFENVGMFGCEVFPLPPLQAMAASLDIIAGNSVDPMRIRDRSSSLKDFTGAQSMPDNTEVGFGGAAEPPAPQKRVIP
jgi:hypothetical protein